LSSPEKSKEILGDQISIRNDSVKTPGARDQTEKFSIPFTSEIGSISYILNACSQIGVTQLISSFNSLQSGTLRHECCMLDIVFHDTGLKYSSFSVSEYP
jgi:hypothetical protein